MDLRQKVPFFINYTKGHLATVTGTDAINLPKARPYSLKSLTAFGDTEQLPQQYIDSVTLSGGTEQRNLPEGYTQLEYLRSDGTQYIDLGYKGNGNTKVRIKARYYTTTTAGGSGRIFGSHDAAAVNAFAIGSASGTASTNSTISFFFGNQSYLVTDKAIVLDEWLDVIFDKTTHSINGVDYGDPYNNETFETPQTLKIFGFDNNGTIGFGYVDIAQNQLWDNNVLVRDLIPAKNSSNELGMYDTVSGTFFPNQGTGDFVAGPEVVPTPDNPIDIVCNNGAIKCSANLCDVKADNIVVGQYIAADGTISDNVNNYYYSKFIKVQPNTSYTLSFSESVYFISISEYSTADDSGFVVRKTAQSSVNTPPFDTTYITITTEANTNYIRFGSNVFKIQAVTLSDVLAIDWMLNIGSTAMPYMPYGQIYTDGTIETITDNLSNTATAEMLLKVGDYQDTQEVIAGSVTRNVGVKALDGTEDWNYNNIRFSMILSDTPQSNNNIAVCSHYKNVIGTTPVADMSNQTFKLNNLNRQLIFKDSSFTTLSAWTTFLADQYAAGTPVIVVYPLVTSTTETVASQFLSKSPVTQTAGSISNLPITVTESSHTVPTPQQPLDINCNNGVIKLSPNLFNKNSYTEINAYVNSKTGVLTQGTPGEVTQYCAVIPCKPNTTYTISGRANSAWGAFTSSTIGTTATNYSKTENGSITTGANDIYLIGLVRANSDVIDYRNTLQIEQGSTVTPYKPYGIYVDGTVETITDSLSNTATAQNLLKVGDYADIQEVISGSITRNVGVKVLTGDNTKDGLWGTSAGASNLYSLTIANSSTDNTFLPISTHFVGVLGSVGYASIQDGQFKHGSNSNTYFFKDTSSENVTEFKAFLATQYAAGTPVVVIYPLATETTETVAEQTLQVQNGDNTIQITQASMDDLKLEAVYRRNK